MSILSLQDMASSNRVTTFPSSESYRASLKRPSSPDNAESQNKTRARFLQQQKPPRLQLPVNSNSLFSQNRFPRANLSSPIRCAQNESAQETPDLQPLQMIAEEDQAGIGTVFYRDSLFTLLVLKTRQIEDHNAQCLVRTDHKNLCNLLDFYYSPNSTTMNLIYEDLAISLPGIQASTAPIFRDYELAAIITEVGR